MTTRDFRRALLVGVGALGCWAATHTDEHAPSNHSESAGSAEKPD